LAAALPQNRDLALKEGKKDEAIENLLGVEKQTRLAGDAFATGKVAVEIVKILFECKDWEGLSSNIVLISKRRQQLKQVLVDMVQEAMKYVDEAPDYDKKMELIHTLRAVTEGKIHVELERARLTRQLSKIRESEGKIAEAADLLSEVQVETYGSMDKEEKVEYILEQVRLCLDKGDFVRGAIVSKKLTAKTFKDDILQELKIRYYELLNRICDDKDEHLEMANNFYAIFHTPIVQEKTESWTAALKSMSVHLCLAPHDNHHQDFLVRLLEEKKLDQLKAYKVLLTLFKTMELIQWSSFQVCLVYQPCSVCLCLCLCLCPCLCLGLCLASCLYPCMYPCLCSPVSSCLALVCWVGMCDYKTLTLSNAVYAGVVQDGAAGTPSLQGG